MLAITIRQPWAWAICAGFKTVENRTWQTSHRGELLIHAGTSRSDVRQGLDFLRGILEPRGITCIPDERELVFGAILGVVNVIDCIRYDPRDRQRLLNLGWTVDQSPFATGPYCWLLESHGLYDVPTPCRGMPGLFLPDCASR